MPALREPTPSPPPVTASSQSGSGEVAGGGSGVGGGMEELTIPANFVPPPPPREVATGVSNLGNTCYMNAALQALAHAPELCHALDAESHLRRCPIALRNERRRRKHAKEAEVAKAAATAARDAGDAGGERDRGPIAAPSRDGGKSHRRSNSGSSSGSAGSKGKKQRKKKVDSGG